MKLKGRTALVTGASRGIGRAVAVELARQGANVGINFRSHPEEAEEVAKEVRAAGARRCFCKADVADHKIGRRHGRQDGAPSWAASIYSCPTPPTATGN